MSTKRFFTLVEMMAVVALVLLLLSLLLPALARIRNQADIALCGSNLKQLYTYHWLHAKDHKGNIVTVPTHVGYCEFDNFGRTGWFSLGIMDRRLNYYIDPNLNPSSSLEIANCPTDAKEGGAFITKKYGTSYYTNIGYLTGVFASRGYDVMDNPKPTDSIMKVGIPSQMMLLGELGLYWRAKGRDWMNFGGHWAENNEGSFNLVTVDGALKTRQYLGWGATANNQFDLQNQQP